MIVRSPREDRYTIINRSLVNDDRLSYRALGLLAYILDKPDNWRIDAESLSEAAGREGRDAVRSALNELEGAGYLLRNRTRRADGTFCTESTVYDQPPQRETSAGLPTPVSQAPIRETVIEDCNEGSATQSASARPRNPLFDALVVACGMQYDEMTDPARKRTGVAVAQLAKVGATPEEVLRRAEVYREVHTASLTPTALASQWAALRDPVLPRPRSNPVNDALDAWAASHHEPNVFPLRVTS